VYQGLIVLFCYAGAVYSRVNNALSNCHSTKGNELPVSTWLISMMINYSQKRNAVMTQRLYGNFTYTCWLCQKCPVIPWGKLVLPSWSVEKNWQCNLWAKFQFLTTDVLGTSSVLMQCWLRKTSTQLCEETHDNIPKQLKYYANFIYRYGNCCAQRAKKGDCSGRLHSVRISWGLQRHIWMKPSSK